MSAGPIHGGWHDHFPVRPSVHPRRVEPVMAHCPPPACRRERFEPLPFDTFLARQNQEFRAAVQRQLDRRRPVEPAPCPPPTPSQAAPHSAPAPQDTAPPPVRPTWPHIGDVTPVPPHDPPPRLRTVQQFLPPLRPGRVIDLFL